MAAVVDSALRRNVACPFCGLACDDLSIAVVAGDHVTVSEAGCALSRKGFERAPAKPTPMIGSRAASLDEAMAAAVDILRNSRQPLFAGLATDVAGLRAVMQLAERTGGIVDHLGADGFFRNLRVVQDSGWMTTTLSEVRNRVDLLLIVGPDPTPQFPRFYERCVAARPTLFAETNQPRVVRLGPAPAGDVIPAQQLVCDLERLPEAVAALRCLVGGRSLAAAEIAGLPVDSLRALAGQLKAATYGVVTWMAGAFAFAGAELLAQALADLVRDVNQATRCAALPLTGSENVMGAHQVCTWQTGFPLRTSFAGGAPAHDPLLYGTARLLREHEVDALVWISSFHPAAPPATRTPTIVLAAAPLRFERQPEVHIPIGTPGIDHAGEIFRTDGVVALPLAKLRDGGRPSAADVLGRIDRAFAGVAS